jgi:tetratricopeptide (TPR) repeat protein
MYKHDSLIYFETIQKDELYYDDQPLETMLYSSQPLQNPSPVDILRHWMDGLVLTKVMEGAVVKILINNYRLAMEENKEAEACLILKTALSEIEYPAVDKLKALIALWKLSQVGAPVESKEYYSSAKEFFNQSRNEMDENTRKYWGRLLNAESSDIVLYSLRAKAYDEFEAGRYAEAEKIYLNLIGHKFELPGTYCHLARVQLLMHDENAALKSVNCAWALRKTAVKYVLPRIVFLKILLVMRENRNPFLWIFRMKTLLTDDSVFLQWSIESTIKQYELMLNAHDYFFLLSLARAIQEKGKTETLEEYDIWNSRTPGI